MSIVALNATSIDYRAFWRKRKIDRLNDSWTFGDHGPFTWRDHPRRLVEECPLWRQAIDRFGMTYDYNNRFAFLDTTTAATGHIDVCFKADAGESPWLPLAAALCDDTNTHINLTEFLLSCIGGFEPIDGHAPGSANVITHRVHLVAFDIYGPDRTDLRFRLQITEEPTIAIRHATEFDHVIGTTAVQPMVHLPEELLKI